MNKATTFEQNNKLNNACALPSAKYTSDIYFNAPRWQINSTLATNFNKRKKNISPPVKKCSSNNLRHFTLM